MIGYLAMRYHGLVEIRHVERFQEDPKGNHRHQQIAVERQIELETRLRIRLFQEAMGLSLTPGSCAMDAAIRPFQ
jgi:hypothetical protein